MAELIESVKMRDVNRLRSEMLNQEELDEYARHISKMELENSRCFLKTIT